MIAQIWNSCDLASVVNSQKKIAIFDHIEDSFIELFPFWEEQILSRNERPYIKRLACNCASQWSMMAIFHQAYCSGFNPRPPKTKTGGLQKLWKKMLRIPFNFWGQHFCKNDNKSCWFWAMSQHKMRPKGQWAENDTYFNSDPTWFNLTLRSFQAKSLLKISGQCCFSHPVLNLVQKFC